MVLSPLRSDGLAGGDGRRSAIARPMRPAILARMSGDREKHRRIESYAEAYLGDYGFEGVMVDARQRLALELLAARRPARVLEAGCGADLLCERAAAQNLPFAQWTAVEPSAAFADIAARFAAREPRFALRRGFLEDEAPALAGASGPFDFVLVAGLLGEIADPLALLRAAKDSCAAGGLVHVNVPNAYSLHRRLARAMGLIADEHEMSDRNRLLQQHRVYDPARLRADVESAGLEVIETGGYLLKPFTHAQMEEVTRLLGRDILAGLWQMGRELPDWASEIYVNARPRG
jgi:SAM-dependent methyltransferase